MVCLPCVAPVDQFDAMFPTNAVAASSSQFLGPNIIRVWNEFNAKRSAILGGLSHFSPRPGPMILATTSRPELVPVDVQQRQVALLLIVAALCKQIPTA